MSASQFSDVELLRACADDGSEKAWGIFVRRYSPAVWGAIRKTLRLYHVEYASEEIEDVYSTVFLSLLENNFKKLRLFGHKNSCSLNTWITIVSVRVTIDYIRKEKKHRIINSEEGDALLESIHDPAFDPEENLERKYMDKVLLKAVDKLSPKDKTIYEALFTKGISPQETAGAVGLSLSAVFTRKTRIIDKIKKSIQNM